MKPKKKKILIVEDEATIRYALKEKLEREGYDIIEAPDGEAGLGLGLSLQPDLILLDLLMPKLGGLEMLEELRSDEWGKSAKVIILTNVSDMNTLSSSIQSEVFTYLIKADTPLEKILETVKENIT